MEYFLCFLQTSELLAGREICVISGPSSHPKAALEKKVVECGGSIVQNPGKTGLCTVQQNTISSRVDHFLPNSSWNTGITNLLIIDLAPMH